MRRYSDKRGKGIAMKFDTGFFAGLIIIWIGIIASPGTIGLAIFDIGGVFIKKTLREPFMINRYDPCPDQIDFTVRP